MPFILEIPLSNNEISVFVCKHIVSNDNPPNNIRFSLDMFGFQYLTEPSNYYMSIKFIDSNKLFSTIDNHVHQINPPPQILNLPLVDQIIFLKDHGFEYVYCAATKVNFDLFKGKNTKKDIQKYLNDNKIIPAGNIHHDH